MGGGNFTSFGAANDATKKSDNKTDHGLRGRLLPAHGILHAHLPTAATGLDDARHHGWAWKRDVRWKLSGFVPYRKTTSNNFSRILFL